ncbi:putative spliceosome factor [Candida maltosa Xu316]|uniref:Putative spliceosome factor n=1 Tax=Candida maltosa (strain Xu316) TaxID=1245528 RepID=M3K681_CANMX|nr:putative spliceosome factor [Candida maltosa Xu316]
MSEDFPARPPHPSGLEKVDIKTLDERLILEKETQTWLFEKNGHEYEYDYMKSQWISTSKRAISDEDANKEDIKRQRKEDMSKLKSELNQLKKRKRNTAVYVSNLPIDLTVTDIEHAFNNFGKIQVGKDGNLKIKMYNDDSGKFKGEALVIFAQPDSASLAIEMMDNSLFNGQNIRVEEAKFDEKKDVPNKTEPGVMNVRN